MKNAATKGQKLIVPDYVFEDYSALSDNKKNRTKADTFRYWLEKASEESRSWIEFKLETVGAEILVDIVQGNIVEDSKRIALVYDYWTKKMVREGKEDYLHVLASFKDDPRNLRLVSTTADAVARDTYDENADPKTSFTAKELNKYKQWAPNLYQRVPVSELSKYEIPDPRRFVVVNREETAKAKNPKLVYIKAGIKNKKTGLFPDLVTLKEIKENETDDSERHKYIFSENELEELEELNQKGFDIVLVDDIAKYRKEVSKK